MSAISAAIAGAATLYFRLYATIFSPRITYATPSSSRMRYFRLRQNTQRALLAAARHHARRGKRLGELQGKERRELDVMAKP